MAGIRGKKNPMPKAGGSPTGIFSSKGRQKMDGLSASQSKLKGMSNNNYDKPRQRGTRGAK